MSLVWGLLFGINTIVLIWIAQPFTKLFFTWLRLFGILLRAVLRTVFDPCFQSCGLALSLIRGTFNINNSSAGGAYSGHKIDTPKVQQI